MATKKPADLASIRVDITCLTAERLALNADHRGENEARADVMRYTRAAVAELDQRLTYAVAVGDLSQAFTVRPSPNGTVDCGPLLAAVLGPDVLAAALERHVQALPAVDRAAVAARLAEITDQLAELEEAEELLICEAERAGMSAGRRADARPEIVLKLRN